MPEYMPKYLDRAVVYSDFPASPRRMCAQVIRQQWGMEHSLQRVLDISFEEYVSPMRKDKNAHLRRPAPHCLEPLMA